jgi:hypothetical protein
MARKRAPEDDYICQVCQCACDRFGKKHLGGGDAYHRACGKPPVPILRTEWNAMIKAEVSGLHHRPVWHDPGEEH